MTIVEVDGIRVPVGSHEGKTLFIGSDHRGFAYKQKIIEELKKNYNIADIGTHSPDRCDYTLISPKLGFNIGKDPYNSAGIGICGSGIGIISLASKCRRVYAATCWTPQVAAHTRRHNNTNLLGIGADYTSIETAFEIIGAWLETPFGEDDERYIRRFVQTVQFEDMLSTCRHCRDFMEG